MDIITPEEKTALECNLMAGQAALASGDASSALYFYQVAEHVSPSAKRDFMADDDRFAKSIYHLLKVA